MTVTLACSLPLAKAYRREEILAFHRRDTLAVAERVDAASLAKGLVWRGVPAHLAVAFLPGRAEAELHVDDRGGSDQATFEATVRRMLGLTQEIEKFERRYRSHPLLGPLIALRPGLRVAVAATPFEALTWAVTGQQISLQAAVCLRRRLIVVAGVRHSQGLLCYPDAARVAVLGEDSLRQAGFSATKTQTLLTLARMAADGALPLDAWTQALPVEEVRERLHAVRGVGPWTIDYVLLRGFGWLDGSLHGDAAVRRGLQKLLGTPEKIGAEEARAWLAPFSPWRALVAAHLWAVNAAGAAF